MLTALSGMAGLALAVLAGLASGFIAALLIAGWASWSRPQPHNERIK